MMPQPPNHRLRLKLPTGAELEAEGSPEFITQERREFLACSTMQTPSSAAAEHRRGTPMQNPLEPAWEELIESKGNGIQLRAKLKGDSSPRDACLVLIAASQRFLRNAKPTAAQLARWLRASGYPVRRVDRAIRDALQTGEILASGSRRGRRYELSGPGLARAFSLGLQLAAMLRPSSQPAQ
ncbi:MAG: hypothetical protein WC728_10995 [Elusimicrobiota bacterium]